MYPFRNPHYLNRCLRCHARQSSSGLCSDAGATTCSPFSVCEAGEEEARAPTASSDRMCTPCKPGRRCAVGWHGTMCLYRLHACECVHAVTGITSFVCMHACKHACMCGRNPFHDRLRGLAEGIAHRRPPRLSQHPPRLSHRSHAMAPNIIPASRSSADAIVINNCVCPLRPPFVKFRIISPVNCLPTIRVLPGRSGTAAVQTGDGV